MFLVDNALSEKNPYLIRHYNPSKRGWTAWMAEAIEDQEMRMFDRLSLHERPWFVAPAFHLLSPIEG
jgi:hypothetical protein